MVLSTYERVWYCIVLEIVNRRYPKNCKNPEKPHTVHHLVKDMFFQSGYCHQKAMPTTLDSTLIVPLSTLVDRYNHNVVCTLIKCDFF